MDESLRIAFAATEYRVRLTWGGWATIHVDRALPAALSDLVGAQLWGFITAWNPHAQFRNRADNRRAQRSLLTALRRLPSTIAIRPAMGVGTDWREPSLFVVGPDTALLDALAKADGQRAYVHGHASGHACLRWLD